VSHNLPKVNVRLPLGKEAVVLTKRGERIAFGGGHAVQKLITIKTGGGETPPNCKPEGSPLPPNKRGGLVEPFRKSVAYFAAIRGTSDQMIKHYRDEQGSRPRDASGNRGGFIPSGYCIKPLTDETQGPVISGLSQEELQKEDGALPIC